MELITIKNENGKQLVSARELYDKLELSERFSKWWDRFSEYGFVENVDYTPHQMVHPQNKQEMQDYILTMDMSKQICMLQRSEIGTKFRLYFIECEKKLNNQFAVPKTYREALLLAAAQQEEIEKLQLTIETDKPKVEFYEAVTESSDTIDMGTVAKVLNVKGVGRNTLFEILRKNKVLMSNNSPFQSYIDKGWFRQIETKFTKPTGDIAINIKTVVFQKGVEGIRKIVIAEVE